MRIDFLIFFLLFIQSITLFASNISKSFIENKGQIIDQNHNPNPGVLFLLNTPGMNVQLRRGGFSYDLYRISNNERRTTNTEFPSSIQFHRIDFNLLGSNPNCEIITTGASSDYTNYYTTGTSVEGVTNVHSYKTVTYKDIYPGIDLQFISSDEIPFKYNFVVHPGGRIDDIKIGISGPEKVKKVNDVLRCKTTIGEVDESIPKCFYKIDNPEIPVNGRFYRIAEHVYGFKVEQELPLGAILFIDPIPTRRWGTFYGGIEDENCLNNSCKTDIAGNVIICGWTASLTNIATAGAFQTVLQGTSDAFVVKFSSIGERLWGTYYGGNLFTNGYSCAIDQDGNIFLVGRTKSTTNIATPGAFQTFKRGAEDGFLGKFTPDGFRLWGTYYGGNETSSDYFQDCSTDTSGAVFCGGWTDSPDFIATPGATQTTLGGQFDMTLIKFNGDGQRVWGTYYGGSSWESNVGIAVSKNGFVYLSGNTISSNNIATPGSFMPFYNGIQKAFLACFSLDGDRLWGTYFGGEGMDGSNGCAVDTGSNVYLIGNSASTTNITTPGVFQTVISGTNNGYIEKFSSSGQRLWGSYHGQVSMRGAAVDGSGYVFFTGGINIQDPSIYFAGGYQTFLRGAGDAYLAKFTGDGQRIWGTYYGGSIGEIGTSCAVDENDNIYLYGSTFSDNHSANNISLCKRNPLANFIATPGSHQPEYSGEADVFLVKFTDCYSPDTAAQIYGPSALCQNSTGVVFSIDPLVTATSYQWCVTGNLTITSGQGTTSIMVDVGPALGTDTISVYGINACDTGFPKVITRRINPRPNPAITGTDTTCTGASNLFTTLGGMVSYDWEISAGGSILTGGTPSDSSCYVVWTTPGSHWVRLNYTDTNGCEGMTPVQHDIWVIAGDTVDVSITSSANPVCAGTSVTFTATPLHGGLTPSYQWKVNGVNVGINSPVYTYIPASLDLVSCILTSSEVCTMSNPDTSNVITMMVSPFLPVSVSVTASADSICAGTIVNFTATPSNGGTNPIFQWKVNGLNVGINSPTYAYIPLNGDVVECALTSSELCTTGSPALSLPVTMTVFPNLPVSVSVSPSANPFCLGTPVTFTAAPVNGGVSPTYQWQVNGVNVGTNSTVFTYLPMTNDKVQIILTSSEVCTTNNPDTSSSITMIGFPGLPADVTVSAVPSPFCLGVPVTFTATPINGGSNPSYQWEVNGVNVGTNSPIYSYVPASGDSIRCIMTSNLPCVSNNPASAIWHRVSISPTPVVTLTPCFDTITSVNAKPIKLKGGIPLGGTYSGPGVSGGFFYPNLAGVGTHVITYAYVNAALCSNSTSSKIHEFTSPVFNCGNNWIDIRDGKSYLTIQIGSQCWFAADLDYGTQIPESIHQRDNCINEKYSRPSPFVPLPSYYQWDELMRYDPTPGPQGLCPPGWHVPTEPEWNTLFANWTNSAFAASPLKYSGYSGFNAFLSGARHEMVQWDYQNFAVFFWSSTAYGPYKAWAHGMNDPDPSVSYYPSLRSNAFSVRCIRD